MLKVCCLCPCPHDRCDITFKAVDRTHLRACAHPAAEKAGATDDVRALASAWRCFLKHQVTVTPERKLITVSCLIQSKNLNPPQDCSTSPTSLQPSLPPLQPTALPPTEGAGRPAEVHTAGPSPTSGLGSSSKFPDQLTWTATRTLSQTRSSPRNPPPNTAPVCVLPL